MINEDIKNIILILFFKKNAKIPEGEPKAKAEKKRTLPTALTSLGLFANLGVGGFLFVN